MKIKDEKELIHRLNNNQIGIIPTDTVYGIVTKLNNFQGIQKIYQIKNRNWNKKMPIIVGSVKQLKTLILFDERIKNFLNKIIQPTTIIYKSQKKWHSKIWFDSSLAVRLVKWDWLKNILLKTGPLVATSCNLADEPPITEFKLIINWEKKVDFIFEKNTQQKSPSIIFDWEKQIQIQRK